MSLFSIQTEKHVLAGLLKYRERFWDYADKLDENCFYQDFHRTVFSLIKQSLSVQQEASVLLISEKIKSLGLVFEDIDNPYYYLESLSEIKISETVLDEAAKNLALLKLRRDLVETADNLKEAIVQANDKGPDEIVGIADRIYNGKIQSYELTEKPENLFADMEEYVEELGNNPIEELGIKTPFPVYNRRFGGLMRKEITAIVARAGVGKSSYLVDMAWKACNIENQMPCLYLDTELFKQKVQLRIVSALSGVGMWYLGTGNWRKNPEMFEAVRKVWPQIKNFQMDHMHVANKNIDQINSIIRHWYYSKVGRGKDALVIYDYIKLTGEKLSDAHKEYQVIGEKVDMLKRVAGELNIPILTAMQLNRSGESKGRKVGTFTEDMSAISVSDRLSWFGGFVGLLRRKVPEELSLDGAEFGTHVLIPLKTRDQGRDAQGHREFVERYINGEKRLVNYYINYNIDKFNVSECGDIEDIIEKENLKMGLQQ